MVGWMSAICSGWLQVFFKTHGPKLYTFVLQKWGAEIKISEITWRPCCSSPEFLLPKTETEDLQHMPQHVAKKHFCMLANTNWHTKIKLEAWVRKRTRPRVVSCLNLLREFLEQSKHILHMGLVSEGNSWFISKQSLGFVLFQSRKKKNSLQFQTKCPSTRV